MLNRVKSLLGIYYLVLPSTIVAIVGAVMIWVKYGFHLFIWNYPVSATIAFAVACIISIPVSLVWMTRVTNK